MATNELPTGAVTFLCSDVEGSTKLLPELGDDYVELLQAHHRIIREAIHEHEGAEISTEGGSFFVVFRDPIHTGSDRGGRSPEGFLVTSGAGLPPSSVRLRHGAHHLL